MELRKLIASEKQKTEKKLRPYHPPRIITRTDDELLEVMGPAMASQTGEISTDDLGGDGLP